MNDWRFEIRSKQAGVASINYLCKSLLVNTKKENLSSFDVGLRRLSELMTELF